MRKLSECDYWDFPRLLACKDPWNSYVEFLLTRHTTGKPRLVCGPLQFVEVAEGLPVNPTFRLDGPEAQELMDMLWNCGLRPTQSKSSIGQLEAVERHLADMRAIAFSELGINKP